MMNRLEAPHGVLSRFFRALKTPSREGEPREERG